MRIIPYDKVVNSIAEITMSSNYFLPGDVLDAIEGSRQRENNTLGCAILDQLIENAGIASDNLMPICQDTGLAVFYVELGSGVKVAGPGLEQALNEGVRIGYREGYLRKSVVADPFRRKNTGDNTPAIVHYFLKENDALKIVFCPKGGGCENMSRVAMLSPGDGEKGVFDFILETVRIAGGKPCPPVIVGAGIGGNFEYSALLAKKATLRKIGCRNEDPFYENMERELLKALNELGIGPMGLGGRTTALEMFIEQAPCHIASLPVAVNIQCHAARHAEIVL